MVWAQAVHFLIGYSVLLTVYREGLRKRYWSVGLLIFFGALLIEIFYDPKYEGDPFWWGGFRDMCFYSLGAFVGVLVDQGWADYKIRKGWKS